jgi:hypothetical protein
MFAPVGCRCAGALFGLAGAPDDAEADEGVVEAAAVCWAEALAAQISSTAAPAVLAVLAALALASPWGCRVVMAVSF